MTMPVLVLAAVVAIPVGPAGRENSSVGAQPETSARKIKEIEKERLAALKKLAGVLTTLAQAGRDVHGEASDARLQLLQAELDAAGKEADRVALHEQTVAVLRQLEEWANAQVKAGFETEAAVLKIRARRLGAEIRSEQAKAKAGDPAGKIKELRKERLTALEGLVDRAAVEFRGARGSYDEVLEAQVLLLGAREDDAETEADRGALGEKIVDLLKHLEQWTNGRAEAGLAAEAAVLKVRARRLDAEIRSEQAKAPAGAPAGKVKELRKERLAALERLVNRVGAAFQSTRASLAEVREARLLLLGARLDDAETEAGRVALYEQVVAVLNSSEKQASTRPEAGLAAEAAGLKIRVRRLDAEIRFARAKAKAAEQGPVPPLPPE